MTLRPVSTPYGLKQLSTSHRLPDFLHTDRLVLREPRASDSSILFDSYTQDPEVARYMIWRPHTSLAETEEFIAGCVRDWSSGLRLPYVLTLRGAPGRAIGMLEARPRSHLLDIGYVLGRAHWGKGFMPEAIRALTDAALSTPGVFRVQATCDVDNRASARALEKSGFPREGRLERHTVHPNIDPEPRPCFLYARCR
jgi:[ribosomal protein S5]-alanine N-acetyltransferase